MDLYVINERLYCGLYRFMGKGNSMQFELTAFMMCANYGNLEQEIKEIEEGLGHCTLTTAYLINFRLENVCRFITIVKGGSGQSGGGDDTSRRY